MHPNAALVQRFYRAFDARDAEAMVACYAPDVVFTDPVFGRLEGARAGDMWRMLATRAKDLRVEASGIEADEATGRAHWIATYAFGKARRPVRNVVEARFRFRDGRIVEHVDAFDLRAWMGQALGPAGRLFGWMPALQARVRAEARAGLDAFVARQGP